jgi:hypothetical protein
MNNDELIVAIQKEMKTTVAHMEKADTSSKALFNNSLKYLKVTTSSKEGVIALNNLADALKTTKHYQKRIKQVVHYASIATDTKLFIDVECLLWYNVEKALKLMEHLAEHYSSDVAKVKNKLNKVLKNRKERLATIENKRKYNNEYGDLLIELYKEYKLEDDDEQKAVKLEKVFSSMSAEGQATLIAKLLSAQKSIVEVA